MTSICVMPKAVLRSSVRSHAAHAIGELKKNQKIRTLAYIYTYFVMFNFELLASDKAIMPFIYEKGQKSMSNWFNWSYIFYHFRLENPLKDQQIYYLNFCKLAL